MPQSLSSIIIHIVFSTKQRSSWIQPEIIGDLHAYMAAIGRAQKALVHEIGGVEDHVHLLVSLPRTLAISDLIEEIKKGSSKWIKTKGKIYELFSWQSGYGAFSVSESNFEMTKKYITSQREHHKKMSFQDEYRLLLQRHHIVYDERYVWD
jgi:putative transposase